MVVVVVVVLVVVVVVVKKNLVWLIVDAEQRTFKISEAWEGKC